MLCIMLPSSQQYSLNSPFPPYGVHVCVWGWGFTRQIVLGLGSEFILCYDARWFRCGLHLSASELERITKSCTFYHILRSHVQILDCDWLNSGHYETTTSTIVCEDISHQNFASYNCVFFRIYWQMWQKSYLPLAVGHYALILSCVRV